MRLGTQIAIVVAAAALVGLLTYGVTSRGTKDTIASRLAEGERVQPAQDKLLLLGGGSRTASLADYRGQVVVLNFWASWCDPCVDELPLLERTHKRLTAQNATVLGVDTQDAQSEALGFVRRFKLTFPSVRDPNNEYGKEFETTGVPETFVIDRAGRIAARRPGPVDQEWLDATLPKLLAEAA